MIEIRPLASPHDAHLCAHLMSSTEPWTTIGRTYEESLELVSRTDREVHLAFEDEAFRGFIILILQGALCGYIQIIAVTHDARGRGVGSELIAFAERRIFAKFPNTFLCVSSFNPRARALYERLGYELVGEMKDYLVRGHSEFLMRKTIGPIVVRK